MIPARPGRPPNHPVRRAVGFVDRHDGDPDGSVTARAVLQGTAGRRAGSSASPAFDGSVVSVDDDLADGGGTARQRITLADKAAVPLTARGFYEFRKAFPSWNHHGTTTKALTHHEAVLQQLQQRLATRDSKHILRLFGEYAGNPSTRVVPRSTFRKALRGVYHGITDEQADYVRGGRGGGSLGVAVLCAGYRHT